MYVCTVYKFHIYSPCFLIRKMLLYVSLYIHTNNTIYVSLCQTKPLYKAKKTALKPSLILLVINRTNQSRLNFFLNLSTRPPASTNFCLPVKNGWHLEQISTLNSDFVERVVNVSPQAHLTVASTYSGCIPCFI